MPPSLYACMRQPESLPFQKFPDWVQHFHVEASGFGWEKELPIQNPSLYLAIKETYDYAFDAKRLKLRKWRSESVKILHSETEIPAHFSLPSKSAYSKRWGRGAISVSFELQTVFWCIVDKNQKFQMDIFYFLGSTSVAHSHCKTFRIWVLLE